KLSRQPETVRRRSFYPWRLIKALIRIPRLRQLCKLENNGPGKGYAQHMIIDVDAPPFLMRSSYHIWLVISSDFLIFTSIIHRKYNINRLAFKLYSRYNFNYGD
ncbi:hypothetical protein, partial [Paenibacillus polymyxa]|uniref:hypothetical protein n=1 Tax=Paenibacillus polymyxa TaxID=1406 RepID=UPI001ED8E0F5